jgi:hypothetical protein
VWWLRASTYAIRGDFDPERTVGLFDRRRTLLNVIVGVLATHLIAFYDERGARLRPRVGAHQHRGPERRSADGRMASSMLAVPSHPMATAADRRRGTDRRQHDWRLRIAEIQADHDDFRTALQQTIEQVKRMEVEQQTQLVRIAQIQQELDALKKARE